MGYKYGVWVVIKDNEIHTSHITHVTIACFMEKRDAIRLSKHIINNMNASIPIVIKKEGKLLNEQCYPEDDNNIQAWGYVCKCIYWDKIQTIVEEYKCNFAYQPHISVMYANKVTNEDLQDLKDDKVRIGDIVPVDICSDNPKEWNILSY